MIFTAGNFGAESLGINAGCQSFHFEVSLINEKIESFSPWTLMAFEIRICEGMNKEIPVTTINRKTTLIKNNLKTLTTKNYSQRNTFVVIA